MANTLYNQFRAALLGGVTGSASAQVDWDNTTAAPKCYIVREDTTAQPAVQYVFSAADTSIGVSSGTEPFTYLSNGGTANSAGIVMAGMAVTADGAADANDVIFNNVDAGQLFTSVVITDANNNFWVYIDTATGLPITANSGDIIVTWDNGVNKIFRP